MPNQSTDNAYHALLQTLSEGQTAPPPPTFTPNKALKATYVASSDKYSYNRTVWEYFHHYQNMPHEEIKSKGEIGLEIECEGRNLDIFMFKWWKSLNDGSLRPYMGHPPIEFVLKKPLNRNKISLALNYLIRKLDENKALVVTSPRTSLHVHINCLDLTIKQAITFVCLYLLVEDLLVEYSGPDRPGNMFCLRAKDTMYLAQQLESAVASEDYYQVCNDNYRYSACNIVSLKKWGSLEFRSHCGTIDKVAIERWIDILLSIKRQALKLDSPVDVHNLFNELGPRETLKYIFPDPDISSLFEYNPNLSEYMWEAVRMIRDIVFANEWRKPCKPEQPTPKKKSPNKKKKNQHPYIEGYHSDQWVVIDDEPMVTGQDNF